MAKKGINILGAIQDIADSLQDELAELADVLQPDPDEPVGRKPTPEHKKVSLIIHNPRIPSKGNKPLNAALGWNDPDELVAGFIKDMRDISYGYANYQVVERIEVDGFPKKADGFVYRPDDFVQAWRAKKGFHDPDMVDYQPLLDDFEMVEKVNAGKVDEFWLFAFPYAGYYESIMAGPGAFWCNAPPLEGIRTNKRFIIMGFNYQRGVGEMLEAYGHRAESILKYVFQKKRGNANLWEKFARYDQQNPGKAEVGIMHFAPNSTRDYEWGRKNKVMSRCDDWYNFPNFKGEVKEVDCSDWGNGDIREHHRWWFKHLPHVTGRSRGIAYNWWQYILDPNTVK